MNKSALIIAISTCAVMLGATAVHAQDTRTISQFLSSCNMDPGQCRDNMHDYVEAAASQNMICLPSGVSLNDATQQSLEWLRDHSAQDSALAGSNAEDGEWTAISTLYDCQKTQSEVAQQH